MYKNSDGSYDIFHTEIAIVIIPTDKWVGLRPLRGPSDEKQEWRNRIGKRQRYQLNLIPCVSILFDYVKWTKILKEKKK